MHTLVGSPTPCAPTCCWPDTYHQPPLPSVHPWKNLTAKEEHNSQGLQVACGPRCHTISYKCPTPLGSSEVYKHAPSRTPHHQLLLMCEHSREYCATTGVHSKSKGPIAACRPRSSLFSCHWPAPLCLPAACPSICARAPSWLHPCHLTPLLCACP